MTRRTPHRRGQLQALEPILVVIFLAIIIGLVLLYYVQITTVEGTRDQRRYQAQEDLALLGRITTLPELSCPRSETVKTYCLDLFKAQAFATLTAQPETKAYYYPVFGSANVTLYWLDLKYGAERLQSLRLYSSIGNSTNVKPTTTYFTAYEPVDGTRQFAMLVVERQTS
jgi:hypothetical protein